jgi:hypothetical protein
MRPQSRRQEEARHIMPIPTTGAVGDVPAGIQTLFLIRNATFEPAGKYGPDIELELDLVDDEYVGTSTTYWASIQRPRIDKVEDLRENGLDDEDIARVLRKQGFEFEELDEPDTFTVGRGGNLYKILVAVNGGDRRRAEAVLERCNDFDELAEALKGGRFVGTTKHDKDGKYVRLDGQEDIYADMSSRGAKASAEEINEDDEDFNNLPF